MYLLGYSLDNLSLMALTIATGFVVDDAIVVIENITRHLEAGMPPLEAALRGAARDRLHRALDQRLAGGGVHPDPADGRHRRPAVPRVRGDARRWPSLVSLVVSLTTTPMMCARCCAAQRARRTAGCTRCERARLRRGCSTRYAASAARWVLRHQLAHAAASRSATIGAQRLPLRRRAQGLLPAAGHRPPHRHHPGRPGHLVPGDARRSSTSSSTIVADDPAVDNVVGLHRRRRRHDATPARMFIALKPLDERRSSRRRRSSRGCAASSRRVPGADAVPAGGAGRARRRPRAATRSTSTRCRARRARTS